MIYSVLRSIILKCSLFCFLGFFLLVALVAQTVYADILFLDLNNSPLEVEAAMRAAKARGEKLIVKPEQLSVEKTKKAERLLRDNIAAANAFDRCNYSAGRDLSIDCTSVSDRARNASNTYNDFIESNRGKFDSGKLNQTLKEIKGNGIKLSSVIISGHDGNGHFGGELGDLDDKSIGEAFKANEPVGDNIRSLLLWGCYTTNLGSLEYNWKKNFPNANMIAGFDGMGPSKDRPANHQYLEDVLKQEKRLTEARDNKQIRGIIENIRGLGQTASAICVNQDTVVTPTKIRSIKKEKEVCINSTSNSMQQVYECYLKAQPECPDVPKETSRGPLRDFYNFLQNRSHCEEIELAMGIQRPDRATVIRLIFDKEVRKNFQNHCNSELLEFDKIIERLGWPDNLKLSGVGSLSRQDFLNRLSNLTSRLNTEAKAEERTIGGNSGGYYNLSRSGNADLVAINSLVYKIQQNIAKLNPEGVPFGWVEPGATAKSYICQDMSYIQKEAPLLAANNRYNRSDTASIQNEFEKNQDNVQLLAEIKDLEKKVSDLEMDEALAISRNADAATKTLILNNIISNRKTLSDKYVLVREIKSKISNQVASERVAYYKDEIQRLEAEKSDLMVVNIAKRKHEIWSEVLKKNK